MKIKKLILDTASFVKNVPIWEYGEEYFTVPEVFAEIRDKETKLHIEQLPVQLQFRNPSSVSIKFINEFSKKTGDFSDLSLTDVKVLALTYELEVECKGSNAHLRLVPEKCLTTIETYQPDPELHHFHSEVDGFYIPKDRPDTKQLDDVEFLATDTALLTLGDTTSRNVETNENENLLECDRDSSVENEKDRESCTGICLKSYKPVVSMMSNENCSSSSIGNEKDSEDELYSDDEGWITPSSLRSIKKSNFLEDENVDTACMTSDFAMQNILKHIGLRVIGIDGKLITKLRTYILRCYSCFKTTNKMNYVFCQYCGNKCLKKVSVTVNPDGTQKIWINTRRPINIRGTKFSLPKPRGGKHAINPVLVADQSKAQQRVTKKGLISNDPMHDDYITNVSPFVQRDIYSRSAQLGIRTGKKQFRGVLYWEQKNPNVSLKKKGSSRKKRMK